MRTLIEQLREAFKRSGLTMTELAKRCRLGLDRSTLRRKLLDVKDPVPMRVEEAEALARALGKILAMRDARGLR